jgi:hypothetical protein
MKLRLISVALLLACAGAFAAPTLPIARDGQALQPIVISPSASAGTKATAEELASYLSRISGAEFRIETGDGSRGIVLGSMADFPEPSLKDSLAAKSKYDGPEAYAIRTESKRLLLIGARELSASHAAFRLLENLGCRWFFPSKEWEVIPQQRNLSVSVTEDDRPRILARRIWYGYGAFDKQTAQDYEAWARHNRMAGSFKVRAGHAWQTIIAENKAAFAEHPEYRALVKGERKGEQLCVSNPELRKLAVAWALAKLEKHPEEEMVSMECSDGLGQCECAECARLGTISNRVFGLANEVARAVSRQFPGKMVGTLAYSEHSAPPSFPLEPNVYVQLTAGFIIGPYTLDELIDLWPQKCQNLGFYNYFSVWLWDFDKLPGGRGADVTRIQQMMRRYLARGATSIDCESGNNWGVHGRGYYIANKLMWNPDADVPALLADFYNKAFGPAAPAMQRYYERVEPDHQPLLSRGLLGEALRDVEEAARLAKDRPDVLARIDTLKHYLHYVHLRWLIDHQADKGLKKDLTLTALTDAYRTRREYMNHWAAMRSTWVEQAVKEFGEEEWSPKVKSPKPWIIETPVAREETARWFTDALAYFQPTPVREEVKYSEDLVPVALPALDPAAPLQQSYQNSARFALALRAAEPRSLDILAGVIAWYRDRPEGKYTLTDPAGAKVREGRLKLDGEAHPVSLEVPKDGTYFLEVDTSAGWKFKTEPGLPMVLLNNHGRQHTPLGQVQPLYFYVPRGTKELQYFWAGGPHKIRGPRGELIREVAERDEVVTVPVTSGADGACWSFSNHNHARLYFYNAPNVLAASPATMLLPKELAQREGLAAK